jgi:hypothetical protein
MRYCTPPIGRPRRRKNIVDHEVVESEFGFVTHLKNSLSIAPRGASLTGDLPKTCQLLPSTAILQPQNRYVRFNRRIPHLPLEGMPAGHKSSVGPASILPEVMQVSVGALSRAEVALKVVADPAVNKSQHNHERQSLHQHQR